MRRTESRHYMEEELLLHLLGEDDPDARAATAAHLEACSECRAVFYDYSTVRSDILQWKIEEPSEELWRQREARLLEILRNDRLLPRRAGLLRSLQEGFRAVWDYALENPLPAMGYLAAAVAFASERTITVFRLENVLPRTNQVLEILRQVF
jgi:anti-sigma factor RsiW